MVAAAPFAANAEYIEVKDYTDTYALRANGELVKYREAENNLPQRIAVGVTDFNNSAYITEDGNLYSTDGTFLASGAKSLVKKAPYVDGTYNGEFAYIAADGSLRLPAAGGYGAATLCSNVASVYGNLVLKNDGKVSALLAGNGTAMTEKEILSNAAGIYGNDGEYLVLDHNADCWFVPLANGAFIYSYETLKLDDSVTSCANLDSVQRGNEWSEYDRSALRAGKVVKNLKATNALFTYGDYIYVTTGRAFAVYYNGENSLMSNTREATQYKRGSMNGYVLDQADTLYRNDQDGNKLTSTEVAYPILNIGLTGDGFCIAVAQDGTLYGVDRAVGFGTGLIDENTKVSSVALPICQKATYLYMNGEKVTLTRRIIEREDRTLYPFREVAEMLGAQVDWDENSKTVTATLAGNTVKFIINQSAYEINGERRNMDTVPIIDDLTQSTYIPIRFAAEALGYTVGWNSGVYENTITISR